MSATIWPARRVKDRILCGRRVPPNGPPACMGLIGTVVRDVAGWELIRVRAGVTAEWPEVAEGPVYRETTRAHFPGDRASSGMFRRVRRFPYSAEVGDSPPLTCPCAHGGHLNRVGPELLERHRFARRGT